MKTLKKNIPFLCLIMLLSGCHSQNAAPTPSVSPPFSVEMSATPQISSAPSIAPSQMPTNVPDESPLPESAQKTLIGKATTQLLDKGRSRMKNIRLAAEQISGIQILPNETFSFNKIVGERSEEAGYEPAPVLENGEKKTDFGGGVCQLATTIMQAASTAELKITERHDHQKEVGYAEKGNDAAVQYDNLDMKFINDTNRPIELLLFVGNNSISAEIYRLNY